MISCIHKVKNDSFSSNLSGILSAIGLAPKQFFWEETESIRRQLRFPKLGILPAKGPVRVKVIVDVCVVGQQSPHAHVCDWPSRNSASSNVRCRMLIRWTASCGVYNCLETGPRPQTTAVDCGTSPAMVGHTEDSWSKGISHLSATSLRFFAIL